VINANLIEQAAAPLGRRGEDDGDVTH
jgi:hypothetical protein